ncbi:MAG: hypothetical protein HRU36_03770 [Rickettsiales bacterium]|nr:hypothetical protein [Rickettsiales bacterium]
MAKKSPNLFEVLPRINATVNVLAPQGLTRDGLLSVVFPNAEALLETKFWPKFIEKYTMKSPITLFKGFNVEYLPKLQNVLPTPLPVKKSGRSR